jgi:putative transposase
LEAVYAIVYLDCLVVKIRDGQAVRNHACYLAIGVNLDGERDVLGIWFERSEGAKFCCRSSPNCASAASPTSWWPASTG